MINTIRIQNFRCFEDFQYNGFERVNLIGGKNNSGKTCLLEALACLSEKFTHDDVSALRNEKQHFLVNKNAKSNLLKVIVEFNTGVHQFVLVLNELKQITSLQNRAGLNVTIITQKNELPVIDILKSFDEFDAKLIKDQLIDILKIIDPRIEDMRTFKTKEGLHIKCENDEYKPLSHYGDATKNLIRYFTPIFEKELTINKGNSLSILLIDEIENGLHYTSHYEFWKNVFLLSDKLNVQIFATTHSLEMIKAFNQVALKNKTGAYFEMGIDADTGKVFAEKHDSALLNSELLNPHSTLRGE